MNTEIAQLKIQRFTITALVAVSLYILFTAISFFYYPTAYSPLTNWLSDLGNPLQNPSGAIYYKIGGVNKLCSRLIFCRNVLMDSKR